MRKMRSNLRFVLLIMMTSFGWTVMPVFAATTAQSSPSTTEQKQVFFSGQIAASDVGKYAAQGIRSIVDARPDSELSTTEPSSQKIEEQALTYNLSFLYDPVVPNQLTTAQVKKFASFYNKSPKPVLIYCRSGKRAHQLYEAAKNQGLIE